jgi:hypothetical protein
MLGTVEAGLRDEVTERGDSHMLGTSEAQDSGAQGCCRPPLQRVRWLWGT